MATGSGHRMRRAKRRPSPVHRPYPALDSPPDDYSRITVNRVVIGLSPDGETRTRNPRRTRRVSEVTGSGPASLDGETRTRTGDTTIFRRSLETLEPGENTRKQGGCRRSLAGADPRRFHSFHGDSGDDRGLVAFFARAQ